ncbi:surface-adhesin E family protein [Xylophilus sp.]|uniref:surface-adhesin E family protein n=1 Tax=Xylophilus sp. TaxID=2653893 RepID=UPI0013B8FC9D|nr:surface-adhesin E family protein [Xylophilus sp.]KAF1043621.1 MAG: hypothetical protein GAK38_03882 [Xylophilus sp.]
MKILTVARASIRWFLLTAGIAAGAGAAADPSVWLTVSEGGPQAPDVVEVAADQVTVFNEFRLVRVRFSRASVRRGYDGQNYRSAEATVQVDCQNRTAGYSALRLYDQPRWQGAWRDVTFGLDNLPRMAFADMQPNPSERILDAACRLGEVQSTDPARR